MSPVFFLFFFLLFFRASNSLSLAPSLSLPSLTEDARAARRRARREICWTSSSRSSTTSLTRSPIQQASCAWCPETTCSTGSGFMQITLTSLRPPWLREEYNQQALLRPTFPLKREKKKKIKIFCTGKEILGYCGSSVKGVFSPLFSKRRGSM